MKYEIKVQDKISYIEEGTGEPLLLLHGLFGALSNFEHFIEHFNKYINELFKNPVSSFIKDNFIILKAF
jgi:hypothetical protein